MKRLLSVCNLESSIVELGVPHAKRVFSVGNVLEGYLVHSHYPQFSCPQPELSGYDSCKIRYEEVIDSRSSTPRRLPSSEGNEGKGSCERDRKVADGPGQG